VCALSFTFLEHLATGYQLEENDAECIHICSDRNYAIFSIFRRQVSGRHDKKILDFQKDRSKRVAQNGRIRVCTDPDCPRILVWIELLTAFHFARPKSPSCGKQDIKIKTEHTRHFHFQMYQ
jgi:hypothetical protein